MPNSTRSSPSTHRCSATFTASGPTWPASCSSPLATTPNGSTTEAKFAALVGVAPVPASSGKTTRHRLSRGGDRQANKAIHHVALVRMMSDTRTKTYVARRRQEGKSTKEIMRCLKRYVAREIYDQLLHPQPAPDAGALRALRKTKKITLQAAADNLQVWPTGCPGSNADSPATTSSTSATKTGSTNIDSYRSIIFW